MILCGLDECGRGSIAGPLVAGGVIFLVPDAQLIPLLPSPLRDSKKLTALQRQRIYDLKDKLPIKYHLEYIGVDDINEHGVAWANKEVFLRLSLTLKAERYLVDGNLKFGRDDMESVVHGDSIHPQIMLASILAKVERDMTMIDLHQRFPHFNWADNAGYCTREHLAALRVHGLSPLHRTVFANSALSKVN